MHWQTSAWSFIQAELLHNAGAILWQHACVGEKQEIASKCRETQLNLSPTAEEKDRECV